MLTEVWAIGRAYPNPNPPPPHTPMLVNELLVSADMSDPERSSTRTTVVQQTSGPAPLIKGAGPTVKGSQPQKHHKIRLNEIL